MSTPTPAVVAAPSLTLTARQLRDLVAPVVPFAVAADPMLPVLNAVLLQVRGGHLTATATDRFRVGIVRDRITSEDGIAPDPRFRALVRIEDLRRILAIFRPTRSNDPTLRLTLNDHGDDLTVEQGGAFDGMLGATLRFSLETAEFPEVEKLLVEALDTPDEQADPRFYANAHYLADFRHAVRHGDALLFKPGKPGKPALVMCGDYFIGGLMPRRPLESADPTVESWRALLAPTTPAIKKGGDR